MDREPFRQAWRAWALLPVGVALVLLLCAAAATSAQARAEERKQPDSARPPPPRLVVQLGHAFPIVNVAVSPDGRMLLTGSHDQTAKLWDAETGKELLTLRGHSAPVSSVMFSPVGRQLLTGSWDKTVKLWDSTGTLLRTFSHANPVTSAAFSPDGKRIVVGTAEPTARELPNAAKLWDADTGKELRSLAGHTAGITSVAFSPDGRQVLTGSWDATAKLWDSKSGKLLQTFSGHASSVWLVAFSVNGKRLLTCSVNHVAQLWDAKTGAQLRSVAIGTAASVLALDFSSATPRVLARDRDGAAKLWDAEAGTLVRSFPGRSNIPVFATFLRGGKRVLVGTEKDQAADLWHVETGNPVRSFSFASRSAPVVAVGFSRDAQRALIGTEDWNARLSNAVRIWDLPSGAAFHGFTGESWGVRSAVFSPDRRRVLTGSRENTAMLWDAETGKPLRSLKSDSLVDGVAFSPDGRWLATASWDGSARLWNAETGAHVGGFGHYQCPGRAVTTVVFSPDGQLLLAGGSGGAKLWNVATGLDLGCFGEDNGPILSVAFAPSGGQVLTGGKDGTARLWDRQTGKLLRAFVGHSDVVETVAFSSDGRKVVTGSADKTARIWDASTGQELRSLVGHDASVRSAAFAPGRPRVLTGSEDRTAKLWNAETGRCLATLFSLADGGWAVVDEDGRFDASDSGAIEGLHWVVGDTPIELSQLKERYYDPGLLAKRMGFDDQPLRPVERLDAPRLFPLVEVSPIAPGETKLTIRLRNQGGGIGKVRVLVNGREIAADARGPSFDANASEASLDVPLAGPAVRAGQENKVEVIAFNAQGYLASPRGSVVWHAPGEKSVERPEVFAIIGGTTRYAARERSMDLRYAGKDAADVATAIRIAAERLVGADRVHVTLLTDYPTAGAEPPTRDNLRKAFEAARRARSGDVLIVYLAGHGTTAPDGEYWYLTREARSTDLADPEVRGLSGVSSAQLTEWVKATHVTKQVLILDTCAAGAAASKLSEVRALPSDQVLALTRLNDRTGMHVLMGAAADAVSYEASVYGQGLLTYALLQGMRGVALRDGQYVDVNQLFQYARESVPRLAREIGGVQEPRISAPKGDSFDIGKLTVDDQKRIPIATVHPLVLRASFQYQRPPYSDPLGLSRRVNAALRKASEPGERGGAIVFVDVDEAAGALRLTGRYEQEKGQATVDAYLLDGETERAHLRVRHKESDVDGIATEVVSEAVRAAATAR